MHVKSCLNCFSFFVSLSLSRNGNTNKKLTYRIQINISSKWVHVQYEAVVDQIDGEPNAWKTNGDQT